MSFEAVLEVLDPGKAARAARADERRSLRLHARTYSRSAGDTLVLVHNISPTGLLIEAREGALAVGDSFNIDVPEAGSAESTVVWNSGRFFGCEFHRPVTKAIVSAALLRGEPLLRSPPQAGGDIRSGSLGAAIRSKLVPERNLLAAVTLALGLWFLIGAAAYLAFG